MTIMPNAAPGGKQNISPARLLRRREVEARTGIGTTKLYLKIVEGTFPKPVPLGERSVGWLESEVEDWIASRVALRDSGLAPRRRGGPGRKPKQGAAAAE